MKWKINSLPAFTIVELMVTMVIISVLSASLVVFVVKMVTFQEQERELSYLREKMNDVSAALADYLSVGKSISTAEGRIIVDYRADADGVALETGNVSHVSRLVASPVNSNSAFNFSAYRQEDDSLRMEKSQVAKVNINLIAVTGTVELVWNIYPLYYEQDSENDVDEDGYDLLNSNLRYLEIEAQYKSKRCSGVVKTGRIVRLWNREQ